MTLSLVGGGENIPSFSSTSRLRRQLPVAAFYICVFDRHFFSPVRPPPLFFFHILFCLLLPPLEGRNFIQRAPFFLVAVEILLSLLHSNLCAVYPSPVAKPKASPHTTLSRVSSHSVIWDTGRGDSPLSIYWGDPLSLLEAHPTFRIRNAFSLERASNFDLCFALFFYEAAD